MKDLWVVFDGPPGPKAERFVEVENGSGVSVRPPGVSWVQSTSDGYWRLGPFSSDLEFSCSHSMKRARHPPVGKEAVLFFCVDCGDRFEVLYENDGGIIWRALDAKK